MITLRRVPAAEYADAYRQARLGRHVFNSPEFTELNARKVLAVHYLLFEKEGKLRGGITIGQTAKQLRSPFSAPYGGWWMTRQTSVETLCEIASGLKTYAEKFLLELEIGFPPMFYDEDFLTSSIFAFTQVGEISLFQADYYLPVTGETEARQRMSVASRNKLNFSLKQGLIFEAFPSGSNPTMIIDCHDLIRRNHEERSHPLAMSFDEVSATARLLRADIFMVYDPEGRDLAAALIYRVTPSIAQVIYWGNLEYGSHYRPMNFLSHKIIEYYREKTDVRIIDVGPGDTYGEPNFGLQQFKEGIGCGVSPRIRVKV